MQPQEVSHPQIVLIVGCCGLASNILGLLLFHEHGHGHGHSHGHSHGARQEVSNNDVEAAEAGQYGQKHKNVKGYIQAPQEEENGCVESQAETLSYSNADTRPDNKVKYGSDARISFSHNRQRDDSGSKGIYSQSKSRPYTSLEDIHIHPASLRNDIISAARLNDFDSDSDSDLDRDQSMVESPQASPKSDSPLMRHVSNNLSKASNDKKKSHGDKNSHKDHSHHKAKSGQSGHHSHGDLNMRGVFLHVMGDALGNVGVILSALVIWLTSYSWRFYADPLISLLITVIILASAIPLCKAASRILLQAVPAGIDVNEIKADIEQLPNVLSAHHLHVWQLSDTKLVASIHVQLGFDFKGEGSAQYMQLAREIRKCLHEYGIHSSTIQPEFWLEETHDHTVAGGDDRSEHGGSSAGRKTISKQASKANSLRDDTCLLECEEECGQSQCCAPVITHETTEEAAVT